MNRVKTTFQGKVIALAAALAVLIGLPGCDFSERGAGPGEKAQTEVEKQGLPDRVLANLWMSTSAEYEALCLMTFGLAYEKIKARAGQADTAGAKPVAIITDLDSTIMDNSLFDSYLAVNGVVFSRKLWSRWETNHAKDVHYVPGAKDFIRKVRGLGVEVVFISNRYEKNREHTIEAMVHMGLLKSPADVSGDNKIKLQLASTSSSKEKRRERVRDKYRVIAYLGDTLADFSADFDKKKVKTFEDRSRGVTAHSDKWGEEWFILPNPVYGHWEKPIDMKKAKDYLPRLEEI